MDGVLQAFKRRLQVLDPLLESGLVRFSPASERASASRGASPLQPDKKIRRRGKLDTSADGGRGREVAALAADSTKRPLKHVHPPDWPPDGWPLRS